MDVFWDLPNAEALQLVRGYNVSRKFIFSLYHEGLRRDYCCSLLNM